VDVFTGAVGLEADFADVVDVRLAPVVDATEAFCSAYVNDFVERPPDRV